MNTQIRGLQIKDADITVTQLANDAVETAKIKDKNVTLAKLEDGTEAHIIVVGDDSVPAYKEVSGDITITKLGAVAIGATKVTDAMINDDVATGLAGVGLSATAGVLAVDINEVGEVVVDVANDSFALTDNSDANATKRDTIADLVTAMAGTGLTATAGVLSVAENIVEGDIQMENLSADVDASGYSGEHTLGNTPIANSVQIYLNGLLQEEGSGKDYTLTGAVIQFATEPISNDIILVHYIIND